MSENGTWKSVATIVVALIGFAILTAIWPSLTSGLGINLDGAEKVASIPAEITPIELNIPAISVETIELSPFAAIGILAGVVVALVVVVGGGLAFLNALASRQTAATLESDIYKEYQANQTKRAKEQLIEAKKSRPADKAPDHTTPRWSVISTSLLILLFVSFFGMIVNFTLVPSGEYMLEDGKLVNSASLVVGTMVAIALIVIFIRIRAQRLADVDQTDNAGIPWNFIVVLTSGLLVVGLGIGVMVYFMNVG